MKNLEPAKQTQLTQIEVESRELEFGDVVVYNEMADQTAVKINLVSEIHSQLGRLEEMTLKRQFLMREILSLIAE